ncbi:MAG: tRNA (adenosine(37)-N6)-threonylcarbamoyltransferase complex ATPase subunit type 1 TsaE [Bacteroidia bacterium]|nr:tRNA (adenosine(37)-N6)-threonylcarbamoyltransferase complex ATPase subunit type 1 TsaE [Bacteroidia bacterium]MBP6656305.1 tRNA (adenosine(37)-N6)-threonylcarbamoyltransferase complex ATPase subunit type 1 TsaE [Bacteroidia bacterium]
MNRFEILVKNESELTSAAKSLINFAGEVKVWIFKGEMGAGKTTFIRYICQELEVVENVSSPTFSIINEYSCKNGELVYHFDFYRIEKEQEAVDIGCEEYFYSGNICLVEWPEKILNLVPEPKIEVTIVSDGVKRKITFSHD